MNDGPGCVAWLMVAVCLVIVVILIGQPMAQGWLADKQAERLAAQAQLVQAEMVREHQRAEDARADFTLRAAVLTPWLVVVIVVCLLVLVLVMEWNIRRWPLD